MRTEDKHKQEMIAYMIYICGNTLLGDFLLDGASDELHV